MVVTQLTAGPVTADQARQKASQFLKGRVVARARGSAPAASELKISAVGKDDSYYIFNAGNNDGFVVVSGEDATEEILGYSDTGNINLASMPCNMRMLFDMYAAQIKYIRENGIKRQANTRASETKREAFHLEDVDEKRLARFDQIEPYDRECPIEHDDASNTDRRSCTGCVATAMAEIMYYHQWPQYITHSIPEYVSETKRLQVNEVPSNTQISWNNIIRQYNKYYSFNPFLLDKEQWDNEDQANAIANLMKLTGRSVRMDYSFEGSSAYSESVPFALSHYFSFEESVYDERENYDDEAWIDKICEEIRRNGPLLYSGNSQSDGKGGHAFVLEGYDKDEFFDINFGWDGKDNGKYKLNVVKDSMQYVYNQGAVFNVKPKKSHSSIDVPLRMRIKTLSPQNNGIYSRAETSGLFENTVLADIGNMMPTKDVVKYDIGVALDKNGIEKNRVVELVLSDKGFGFNDGDYHELSFGKDLSDGIYRLYVASRESGKSDWVLNDNSQHAFLDAAVCGDMLSIKTTSPEPASLVVTDIVKKSEKPLRVGQSSNFSYIISNANYVSNYDGAVLVRLVWKEKLILKKECVVDIQEVQFTGNGSKKNTFSFTPTVSGNIEMQFLNKRWDVIGSQVIDVLDADEMQEKLEVIKLSIGYSDVDSHTIDGTSVEGSLTFYNKDDVTNKRIITVRLIDTDTNESKSQAIFINIGPEKKVSYRYSFTNLKVGHHYVITASYLLGEEFYRSEELLCSNDDTGESIPGNEDLVGYEYWFDDDFDSRKPVSMNSSSEVVRAAIETDHLDDGVHRFNFRLRRSDNKFSAVSSTPFLKLTKEKKGHFDYWIDDDIENRATLPLQDTEEEQELSLDLSGIPTGYHRVNYQLATPGAVMGNTYSEGVMKLASGEPDELEYWFDDNVKNSKRLTGTRSSSNDGYIYDANIDLSGLTQGLHRLNIRATSSGNTRGSVLSCDVLKLASGKATKLEYWFDGDKEHCRLLDGTASDTGVNDYVFVKDLNMSGLEPGHHRLFYRSVSESGITSGAICETPIIVKSRYNVSDPTTLDVTRYSFWVDNESNPEVMDVEDPTYGKTFRHELDARNLKEGDHVVHLKFWNSMGVAVTEEVPFKAVQVDNPSVSLTAEEKNGEVTVRFNTVAYDKNYTLFRKSDSGVKTTIATKGSSYPTNLVWRGTPPAGSYTYYVECVYTDKSGNEQTLTSNEATVSIAKTVTVAYGSITGILMADGVMLPSSGVSVVLTPASGEARTVKVDAYGKFFCEKLPLNSQWTLTVTGDELHEFTAKTVTIEKEGNLTLKLRGKQKEESEEVRITKEHDLALNSTLDCAQNLAFEVKNLSSSKWIGTIEVVAIRKDKMYNYYDNQIPLPVTAELTIKGNDTQQIYIPLEALGRLNKDREYNFKFTTKGKYDTYYSYYRERPLYLAKEYSEDGWYVTQLVEKDRHNQDNIPWTTEQSVYFANLLVKLHSLIGGMNGKIGDADQFRADVVKAAKALTGKYDEKEAVEGMIRWMEGKNALEILANPTIATLSEALTFASPVSASLPLSLKSKLSYAIDGATKAMDYLNGVIAVYDFVKAESDYEKFFVCANWICNVASKTNPLYGILMNSYLVVSKSMITKVIEMGEKLYKRKEAQLLQMNELSSSDGYKYATINKQIDFKIRVKKSGKGYFTPAEIIKQIDYVEAKVSNNSNSPDVVTFRMVEDGDYVALKQTAYNGGGVDDGFNLKQFDLEIHWNNKRVTMVPLAEGDGVDFDKGSGSSDERYIKPACYTIVFKSDSNTPESMGEFIHLK